MFVDAQNQLSDAQALTANAASENYIDLAAARDIGRGEPLALVATMGVDMGGTNPTFELGAQTDSTNAFSSPTTVGTSKQFTSLKAGDKVVLPLPPMPSEEFLRAYFTLGGTSPTATVDCFLIPMSMIDSGDVVYPSNSVVS